MRTLCVISGAVFLLFSGVGIIHYQQALKEVTVQKVPGFGEWVTNHTLESNEFTVTSPAPRILLD
jgi:hypothetical protein